MASISRSPSTSPFHAFRQLIEQLERVHPVLKGEDRANSGLLARMLLVTLLIGGALLATVLGFFPDQIVSMDMQAISIGWFSLPIWFILNRNGRFHLAYNGYVFTALLVFLLPAYTAGSSPSTLAFTGIGYLLAGIFFNSRQFVITIALSCAYVALMIILNVNNPNSPIPNALLPYVGITSFLMMMGALVTTFVTHLRTVEARRRRELEVANEQLRESEHLLEQRVEERTRELLAAKEEAERANLIKSQFLASMSHELRTPLNSILNFSEFLNMGVLGEVTEDQQSALRNITESGQHLLALINDVLDISKIQSGALKLVIEKDIDLKSEVHVVSETTRTLIGEKPVEFRVEVASDLPRIEGDRRRIRQVLLNLLSNAAKFTEEGSVTLKAECHGDEVRFTVNDTGPGIKAQDRDRLFQPFEQTETGIKHTGGTGLGLAISKALVDAHGGRIDFDSTPDVGTSFYVHFPIRHTAM